MKISIVGVTGYSGIELLRLLATHEKVEVVGLYGSSSTGSSISEAYSHLRELTDQTIEPFDSDKIMKTSDLVFIAAPSGVSSTLATPFLLNDFPVIDLSGDFRLPKETYEKWYKKPAPNIEELAKAQYVLADLDDLSANYIANPGCYPTAVLLGLAPIVQSDWIDPTSIVIDAKSGLSGAGKQLSETTHFSYMANNFQMYKPNEHQHIPEIIAKLQTWNALIPYIHFQTSLIPVPRGIFATTFVKLNKQVSEDEIYTLYQEMYQEKTFVRVMPQGKLPHLKQVIGSNYCDLGISLNTVTQTVTIVSVIDNLVKGAAGQAIQNMNKMKNFDEMAGLKQYPVFP